MLKIYLFPNIIIGLLSIGIIFLPLLPALAIPPQCLPAANEAAFFTGSHYTGACVVRGVGSYPTPESTGLPNDSISSLSVGANVQTTLYEDNNYLGRSQVFTGDTVTLQGSVVGDKAVSSLIITPIYNQSGQIKYQCVPAANQAAFFMGSNYTGQCVVRGLGDYPTPDAISLPNDSITSVKVGRNVQVLLYEHNDYFGRSQAFDGDVANLQGTIIGDHTVSSLKIQSISDSGAVATPHCDPTPEQAALFTGSFYSGQCVVLGLGDYSTASDIGLPDDSISSLKLGKNIRIVLYQANNFFGKSGWFDTDVPTLQGSYIGDHAASSIKVAAKFISAQTAIPWQLPAPTLLTAPANDNFANAQIIVGNSGSIFGNNSLATREGGEPNPPGSSGVHSVWYRWQAPASGAFAFTTQGSDFNAAIAVYTGSSLDSLHLVASNGATNETPPAPVIFTAAGGTLYSVAVNGFGDSAGFIRLHWNQITPPKPIRASHPAIKKRVKSRRKTFRAASSATNKSPLPTPPPKPDNSPFIGW